MTFRIVAGKGVAEEVRAPAVSAIRYKSILEVRQRNIEEIQRGHRDDTEVGFEDMKGETGLRTKSPQKLLRAVVQLLIQRAAEARAKDDNGSSNESGKATSPKHTRGERRSIDSKSVAGSGVATPLSSSFKLNTTLRTPESSRNPQQSTDARSRLQTPQSRTPPPYSTVDGHSSRLTSALGTPADTRPVTRSGFNTTDSHYLTGASSPTHTMAENKAYTEGNRVRDLDFDNVDRYRAFTLVVVPDLFMTLDSLQQHLQPLLDKYPLARLLLVGLPGLPNTLWPADWVLNSDLHSRAIARLLQHLSSPNANMQGGQRLTSIEAEPIFLMGFGTGANSLLRFTAQLLPDITAITHQVKAVCIVNGVLKFNQAFRQICKDLRHGLLTANAQEVSELVTSLHFWDGYLSEGGSGNGSGADREACLRQFWSLRRGLSSEGVAGAVAGAQAGLGYVGVLEQLKGILISPDSFDGASVLAACSLPLLVVQSTEDVFVSPRGASVFQPDQLPPERSLVAGLADCLDPGAVHVSWLRAGHEVLQERNAFILGLLGSLAQLGGVRPAEHLADIEADREARRLLGLGDDDNIYDVLELAEQRKKQQAEDAEEKERQRAQAAADRREAKRRKREADHAAREQQRQEEEKKRQEDSAVATRRAGKEAYQAERAQRKLEAEQAEQDRDNMKSGGLERRARVAVERQARNQYTEERRRRQYRQAMQQELADLYSELELEEELKHEEKELQHMAKEDARSKYAAEYQAYEEFCEETVTRGAKKVANLLKWRKAAAVKRVDDNLARAKVTRIVARKKRAAVALHKMLHDELGAVGECQEGKYTVRDNRDVVELINSSQRLLSDLMMCRQRYVEALKRQVDIEKKIGLFRTQLDLFRGQVQKKRRELRKAERKKKLKPELLDAQRKGLWAEEEKFAEMAALTSAREAQLHAANSCVQTLKSRMHAWDTMMTERVEDISSRKTVLAKQLRTLRAEKDYLVAEKDKVRLEEQKRALWVETLQKERLRVKDVRDLLIDTELWSVGVLQRCHTKDLKKYLKQEIERAREKLEQSQRELEQRRLVLLDCSTRLDKTKRDGDKIFIAVDALSTVYNRLKETSIGDLVNDIMHDQEVAETKEEKRRRRQNSQVNVVATAVEKLRKKDADARTRDERRFLALDLVMHPEAYADVSLIEAERMQFDEDYQCSLAKVDLDRIYKLSEEVNLALPFLQTPLEVEAHRLLNTYCRGKDEAFYRDRDLAIDTYYSEQNADAAWAAKQTVTQLRGYRGSRGTKRSVLLMRRGSKNPALHVMPRDIRDSELVHENLLKEAARDRIRAKVRERTENKILAVCLDLTYCRLVVG
jgi:hypothetical protein